MNNTETRHHILIVISEMWSHADAYDNRRSWYELILRLHAVSSVLRTILSGDLLNAVCDDIHTLGGLARERFHICGDN